MDFPMGFLWSLSLDDPHGPSKAAAQTAKEAQRRGPKGPVGASTGPVERGIRRGGALTGEKTREKTMGKWMKIDEHGRK